MSALDQNFLLEGLTTVAEAEAKLAQLAAREEELERVLESHLSRVPSLSRKMTSLRRSVPDIDRISTETGVFSERIHGAVANTQSLALRIGTLDLARERVSLCLSRVNDILDLKFCTDGIQKALTTEDYEQAAAHIHRFLEMDESSMRRTASESEPSNRVSFEDMKPQTDSNSRRLGSDLTSMEEAFQKLHDAEGKLKTIVMKRFDEAVAADDTASVWRFFKLFPLIKQQEIGLVKFSQYLSTKVLKNVTKMPSQPSTFIENLTNLYEGLAKVIDMHQPLVETYYGPGNLLRMISILQKECDRQSKRIFIDFKNKKSLQKVANLVRQSLMAGDEEEDGSAIQKLDPKDVDQLLSEITLLSSRSETYLRFISKRVRNDIEIAHPEPESSPEGRKLINSLNVLLRGCDLSLCLQELNGLYVLMEEYFLRESAAIAIGLDSLDASDSFTSSMLDDCFFLIKKSTKRALSGGNVDVLCAMINHSATILETIFYDTLNERIKYGYPQGSIGAGMDLSQAYNVIQSGRYLQSSTDIEKSRIDFITAINNLDAASEYTNSLKTNLLDDVNRNLIDNIATKPQNSSASSANSSQSIKLDSCLSDLVAVSDKLRSLARHGVGQLYVSLVKPKLKGWIEGFNAANHELSDEDLNKMTGDGLVATADGIHRPFTQQLLIALGPIFDQIKANLTDSNFHALMDLSAHETTIRIEKALIKKKFSRVGALQLELELRAIINFFVSSSDWSLRDKFAKLRQMVSFLGAERGAEMLELIAAKSPTSLLSTSDLRHLVNLRSDLIPDEVRQLQIAIS